MYPYRPTPLERNYEQHNLIWTFCLIKSKSDLHQHWFSFTFQAILSVASIFKQFQVNFCFIKSKNNLHQHWFCFTCQAILSVGPRNRHKILLYVHMSRSTTKPTKWSVHPAKNQISLGIHPVWSIFAVCMKKHWVLSYPLRTLWRLWSDWTDAQADLSLRWVHRPYC